MKPVVLSADFDDLRSRQVRLLQEAARLGAVHALLWPDAAIEERQGKAPKFPEAERRYLLESIRYVDRVTVVPCPLSIDTLPPELAQSGSVWVVDELADTVVKREFRVEQGLEYRVFHASELSDFPDSRQEIVCGSRSHRKRVLVTGCFDWFHSGHVRFFEEVSELGDLIVVVGNDANLEQLKGPGHPMFRQEERRYLVGSIRFVQQALVATGRGWLDAEPEIERLRPDIYAVNEDGHRPEKEAYCRAHGIEYRVLKRTPKQGLPARQSTSLRGF